MRNNYDSLYICGISCINKGRVVTKSYFSETNFFNENKSVKPDASGHRQRIFKRFDESNFDSFSDHEVLEMILFYSFSRCDTKPFAKALIVEFGSLEGVLTAPVSKLRKVNGIGGSTARLIKAFYQLSILINKRNALTSVISISNKSDLIKYLKSSMAYLPIEQVRVLFLDAKNKIIKDEVMGEGTETQSAVFPRKIMQKSLEYHAVAIIMVHNHPSGDIRPSNADISITEQIKNAAKTLNIALFDHLIIGKKEDCYFSFRENSLLSDF
ncbi:MAG: DNA repair protein RadC [Candidatus Riflebacteria bacterium]|nr:DNA repair protein RadC [Candidatus Riflebacteria bacterium]